MKGFMPVESWKLSGIGQALFTGTGLPTGPRQLGAKDF